MNNEVKWNNHVDFIVKKASKKLYPLRILKMQGWSGARDNILKVYLSTVRPVLELTYVVPVLKAIRTIYSI